MDRTWYKLDQVLTNCYTNKVRILRMVRPLNIRLKFWSQKREFMRKPWNFNGYRCYTLILGRNVYLSIIYHTYASYTSTHACICTGTNIMPTLEQSRAKISPQGPYSSAFSKARLRVHFLKKRFYCREEQKIDFSLFPRQMFTRMVFCSENG